MASSSLMNDPANRTGASLASRPKIRYGGDDTNSTNAAGDRRSGGQARLVSPAGAAAPAAAPTRSDNILSARADGTFDAKRTAFNDQSHVHGKTMDEAGNISHVVAASGQPQSKTAPPPGGMLIPGHSPGSSVWQPGARSPAPAAQPSNPSAPPPPPSPAVPPGAAPPPLATATPTPISQMPAAPPAPGAPPAAGAPRPPLAAAAAAPKPAFQMPTLGTATPTPLGQMPTAATASAAPSGAPAAAPAPAAPTATPLTAQPKSFDGKPQSIQAWKSARPPANPSKPAPPPTPLGPAAQRLADFNKANPNVKTQPQIDAMRADMDSNRKKAADIIARRKAQENKPSPLIAGAGFTGPAGEAAARKVVRGSQSPLSTPPKLLVAR